MKHQIDCLMLLEGFSGELNAGEAGDFTQAAYFRSAIDGDVAIGQEGFDFLAGMGAASGEETVEAHGGELLRNKRPETRDQKPEKRKRSGIRDQILGIGDQRSEIGDWRLEIGDWRLEIGDWRFEI